jgi:hypothetical protein
MKGRRFDLGSSAGASNCGLAVGAREASWRGQWAAYSGRATRIVRPKRVGCVFALTLPAVVLSGSSERSPSIQRHANSGTVVAVCSHTTHGTPDCFAMTPDPGTADRDGYYAGGGAVSFERPPAGGHIPRLGEHLMVRWS